VFSRIFVVEVWHKFRGADGCIISARKWFIPHRALIRFAPAIPLGQSLSTVAFVGDSFYSERSVHFEPYAELSAALTVSLQIKYRAFLHKVLW